MVEGMGWVGGTWSGRVHGIMRSWYWWGGAVPCWSGGRGTGGCIGITSGQVRSGSGLRRFLR